MLVITGKGRVRRTMARASVGVLKRQVPLWLALPEFRVYVVGFEDAHVGHGGEGALYVRVRPRAVTRDGSHSVPQARSVPSPAAGEGAQRTRCTIRSDRRNERLAYRINRLRSAFLARSPMCLCT